MHTTDGGACILISRGRYSTSVEHHQVGFIGGSGLLQTS
jgi:hypothetical protein